MMQKSISLKAVRLPNVRPWLVENIQEEKFWLKQLINVVQEHAHPVQVDA